MRRCKVLLITGALAGGALALVPASPASAGVSTSVSGTTITVTVTGDDSVGFQCWADGVRVNGVITSPAVPCETFSHAIVNGDGGKQTVYGQDLNAANFPANPRLTATLAGGIDSVVTSARADSIDLGAGNDFLTVAVSGTTDTLLQLGPDQDYVEMWGTAGNDTFTVTSNNTTATVPWSNGSTSATFTLQNAESLRITGYAGNDTFTDTALTLASSIDRFDAYGDAGNDTFNRGPVEGNLGGGSGTNTFNGGAGFDIVDSNSETDVIHLAGGPAYVYDRYNPVMGGRTIDTATTGNTWSPSLATTDAQLRIRPSTIAGTSIRATASLSRAGQQVLPSGFNQFSIGLADFPEVDDRGLIDAVLPAGGGLIYSFGDAADNDLADITVPTGTWSTTGDAATGTLTVTATGATHHTAQLANFGSVSIHGPWTNKNRGWTHRVYRDLLFRFASEPTLDEGEFFLGNGTVTRPEVTADLMNTDEYRGLDVDRVFVQFLGRKADPSGRASWITSIRNGKALWRFRAQLMGSNEYLTRSGGTNATWVEQAYLDILGRAPDPSGKAYWIGKLNAGVGRGSAALSFINSPEEKRSLVHEQFLRFLDRRATTAELNTWVPTLTGNRGEQNLIAFLANSATYYNRD